MRTIANVATASLNQLKDTLCTPEWNAGEGYNLYKAWVEMRRHNGYPIVQPNEWRNTIHRMIDGMIREYNNPSEYKNIQKRSHWTSTFNLRVCVTVMGGYRNWPKWETECKVFIEA